ncbi:MAG: ATP-binding protein [Verrucomicrobia bacterium]|nr:ATP-binding protein [Verrucomicrobiota bacterium]
MSSLPGVSEALTRLRQFADTVRTFSEREAAVERNYRLQSAKISRTLESEVGAISEALSTTLQQIKTAHLSFRSDLERHFDLRQTHIKRAQERCRTTALQSIESLEGKWKFAIQRDQLQATRQRDEALQAERKRFEEFTVLLTSERDALAAFEARALSILSGYPAFRRQLLQSQTRPLTETGLSADVILERYRAAVTEARQALRRIRRSFLPLLFRFLPVWLLLLLLAILLTVAVPLLPRLEVSGFTWWRAGISFAIATGITLGLYRLGQRLDAPPVRQLVTDLEVARGLFDACGEASVKNHERILARIDEEYAQAGARLNRAWTDSITATAGQRVECEVELKARLTHALARNGDLRQTRLDRLEREFQAQLDRARADAQTRRRSIESAQQAQQRALDESHATQWNTLQAEWNEKARHWGQRLEQASAAAATAFPDWQPGWMETWSAPAAFPGAVRFAQAKVELAKFAGAVPKDARLALPCPPEFNIPLCLAFPGDGSLVLESGDVGREVSIAALNNVVIRLLAAAPPGRLQFTLLDPVELGQSFAGIMHLADYEDRLINGRIWTQTSQIEEQLGRLNEHLEKVAQMYLRNEYATIAEYNAQAGRIAEKYHVLVIADFPANFSDPAARRLQSILASGPRCGVFTLMHHDARRALPADFVTAEMHKHCARLRLGRTGVLLGGEPIAGLTVTLDPPPAPEWATPLLHRIGKASIDSNRVEVPFADVIPPPDQFWSLDTTSELRVPIGRTGATKLQYFALGKGTRQHALVAGKTGSGKSTLFHVLISNLALWCSPEQVEFYLVDFKKGVEFKCYATHRLPHARVVAIESDREFGLSVLERVDEELKRRGELFRKLGAQDLAGYQRAGGREAIPRTLLLIDEFQEFFTEDDRVSQGAALLLDRIVRQGRAFGIHVVLGSQTLGGAYTLARATLGQMVVRIALQCNEADAYLIMDEENPAPRLLTRPGEAIYNDTAGTIEGNSPFQIVWLSDRERDDYLSRTAQLAAQSGKRFPSPVIFEGNAPADVGENMLLRDLLEGETLKPTSAPRAFLGAPNSIKGPTEAVFHRQSGNHLLIVGQRSEAALALLGVSLISLAAQQSRAGARFIVLDANPPESAPRQFLERVVRPVPHDIRLAQPHELDEILAGLAAEMESRANAGHGTGAPSIYLLVHELPKFKKLRYEEDFGFSSEEFKAAANPGLQFNQLLIDGASLGLHVLCTCDTWNNLNRLLSRKAIAEFEMRVLFQMSANDSAALIDSPKAGDLGLHRALFSNGAQGWMETFRPYALPESTWIAQAAAALARRAGG